MSKKYYLLRRKCKTASFGFEGYCSNNYDAEEIIEAAIAGVIDVVMEYVTEDRIENLIKPLTEEEAASMTEDEFENEKLFRREMAVKALKQEVRETDKYKKARNAEKEAKKNNPPFLFFSFLEDDALEGECDHVEDFYTSVSEVESQRLRVFEYYDNNQVEYDPTDYYIAEKTIQKHGESDTKQLTEAEVTALLQKEDEERLAFLSQQRKDEDENSRLKKVGKARVIKRL